MYNINVHKGLFLIKKLQHITQTKHNTP